MSTIIWGTYEDEIGQSIAAWYYRKINVSDFHPKYVAMGILKDDTLCGAAVFCNYNGSNIEVHYWGQGVTNIKAWREALNYAFYILKANRLTAICDRSNKKVLKALPRLGFKFEAILKRYYNLDTVKDAVVHVMFIEDSKRFLKDGAKRTGTY